MKLHVSPASRRPKLTEDERVYLVNLLTAHPRATLQAIATMFAARAGRSIALMSIRRVRVQGYRPPASGRGRSLTEPQRAALERLCREHPTITDAAVARLFTGKTGRSLAGTTVWKCRERLHLHPTRGRWGRSKAVGSLGDGKAVTP